MWEEGESEVSKREGEREEGLLKRRMVKEYHIIVHTRFFVFVQLRKAAQNSDIWHDIHNHVYGVSCISCQCSNRSRGGSTQWYDAPQTTELW